MPVNKRFLLVAILLFGVVAGALAQPGDPGGNPDVPITGIEYLLGLGSLFGFRKIAQLYRNRKRH